jgi:hypothetical protein
MRGCRPTKPSPEVWPPERGEIHQKLSGGFCVTCSDPRRPASRTLDFGEVIDGISNQTFGHYASFNKKPTHSMGFLKYNDGSSI